MQKKWILCGLCYRIISQIIDKKADMDSYLVVSNKHHLLGAEKQLNGKNAYRVDKRHENSNEDLIKTCDEIFWKFRKRG